MVNLLDAEAAPIVAKPAKPSARQPGLIVEQADIGELQLVWLGLPRSDPNKVGLRFTRSADQPELDRCKQLQVTISRGLCRDDAAHELFLRCIFEPSGSESAPHTKSGTPLSEIATIPARCVQADTDLYGLLARLTLGSFRAAPVVNGEGQPIGVVTKSDVLRCYYEHEDRLLCAADGEASEPAPPPAPDVRAIMSHVVFSLPADADVTCAAALMAYEGVHHVIVTGDDGRAVGIVSSLDILRWLARQSGPASSAARRREC